MDRGFGWIQWCDLWSYWWAGWPRQGQCGRHGSRIVGRINDVTVIDDALALDETTAGDIPVTPAPSSQRRRGRLCQGRAVGNDDATQQRDVTRETQEETRKGT